MNVSHYFNVCIQPPRNIPQFQQPVYSTILLNTILISYLIAAMPKKVKAASDKRHRRQIRCGHIN